MSDREKIAAALREALGKTFRVAPERLQDEARLEDFAPDSLDRLELFFAVEERFEIQIPDDKIEGIVTVGDIVDRLEDALPAETPPATASEQGPTRPPTPDPSR